MASFLKYPWSVKYQSRQHSSSMAVGKKTNKTKLLNKICILAAPFRCVRFSIFLCLLAKLNCSHSSLIILTLSAPMRTMSASLNFSLHILLRDRWPLSWWLVSGTRLLVFSVSHCVLCYPFLGLHWWLMVHFLQTTLGSWTITTSSIVTLRFSTFHFFLRTSDGNTSRVQRKSSGVNDPLYKLCPLSGIASFP